MSQFFHPLILALARATEPELARMIEYLKAENRILRGKLPKRVTCTPAERARLVELGREVVHESPDFCDRIRIGQDTAG